MKKSIIILDTETTDLTKAEGASLEFQPHITEIYALKVDKNLKPIDEFYTLIKPPIEIPHFITKHTGIDDYTVRKAPKFLKVYSKLAAFFIGCEEMVAHNLSFDLNMLRYELQRIGKEFNFPYPPKHFCTVERSLHLKGIRLKNNELYKLATGKELVNSHRAKIDVEATFESYKWLRGKS